MPLGKNNILIKNHPVSPQVTQECFSLCIFTVIVQESQPHVWGSKQANLKEAVYEDKSNTYTVGSGISWRIMAGAAPEVSTCLPNSVSHYICCWHPYPWQRPPTSKIVTWIPSTHGAPLLLRKQMLQMLLEPFATCCHVLIVWLFTVGLFLFA